MAKGITQHFAQPTRLKLVPRLDAQGYSEDGLNARREWLENQAGCNLEHIGRYSLSAPTLRGNIENPIGAVQTPLGIAGPLRVCGQHAQGTYYVPLATSEGALVRSYERGMVVLSRAGGCRTKVWRDENQVAPTLSFAGPVEAEDFISRLDELFPQLKAEAEKTTQHGKLLAAEPYPMGPEVILRLRFSTGDAQGMNMIVKAAEAVCGWLTKEKLIRDYRIFSGMSMEKRQGGMLFAGGKGKKVTATALIPAKVVKAYLHCEPEKIHALWQQTTLGQAQAGVLGCNGHLANGLTAMFIACGQDVANVVNAAVGITQLGLDDKGNLLASLMLPSLTVATVGGGTALATSKECLAMMDCFGTGKAKKLAEIMAATLLAGELSFAAAIAGGEFVAAHETYGRNRPERA